MYAKGMTTRQISETIEDIYGFETSEGFISDVTDKILPQCILRSPADSDAFQSGRCAEHNGRPETPIIVS